jgi:hypothetical protein
MRQHLFGTAAFAVALVAGSPTFAQQPARQGCVDLAAAPSQAGQPGQASQPSQPGQSGQQAASKEPATAPDHSGGTSGTSPGSAGSTGWTGGTGGSYVGAVPSGPNQASPNAHPEVATGLDPMKSVSKRKAC